ncbi:helix-turn-helix domain-containing protein [Pseudoclavibacter sp. VKM Ac-2888]|uniref:helix-turn-helix domain-containing protein n=1 Tax=Pseudoclavibacter sp. VKM Ac-2888 TaxID=2783830 RepID=UPI00188B2FAB|nr:helix-turn-helix domain-containing protein [Pseudoclavibacter sp. VKM Ac-2888]MBF4549687.1 helix-turn-helix domain-containing protein [Pseudoclavibacter sp. VKM Ac-2888]
MAEVEVAGAFGAPERVDLAPVRRALPQAPDLMQHLAHLVIKGRFEDGQPVARDVQSTPGRIAPMDQIDATFAWLWVLSEKWQRPGLVSVEHMVRRADDGKVLGPRGVKGTPDGGDVLKAWAYTLVHRVEAQWAVIEVSTGSAATWGQHEARELLEHADAHLLRPLSMWPLDERAPVPARPRECPVCGEQDVWADLNAVTAVCRSCKGIVAPERWLALAEVSRVLGVDVTTVRRWVAAGELESRPLGRGRQVELGAAREAMGLAEARMKLGIGNGPLPA